MERSYCLLNNVHTQLFNWMALGTSDYSLVRSFEAFLDQSSSNYTGYVFYQFETFLEIEEPKFFNFANINATLVGTCPSLITVIFNCRLI